VIIAGGGAAGLETLLALRAVAGDRVDIAIVAPGVKFFNRSMDVDQPASIRGVRGPSGSGTSQLNSTPNGIARASSASFTSRGSS
jgi:hypothetical protein